MKKRDTFSTLHPSVEMLYFVWVLFITMFMMHPIVLATSLISAMVYAIYLKGAKAVKLQLFGVLPLMIITAVMNPLFNHAGVTTLFYLSNGNPITLEAVLYGVAASGMFGSVIVWFSCYNHIMTSDKFIYLFGRIIPALSLLLSMALRFVPKFSHQIKEVSKAQESIGRSVKDGNIIKRLIAGVRVLSITITWALENAVVTADSMKSRGYGLKGRTAYSLYKFDKRDKMVLLIFVIAALIFAASIISGKIYVRYYPSIRMNAEGALSILGYLAFLLFCNLPMILNIMEDITWRRLESKI